MPNDPVLTDTPKTLSDCQADAVALHALSQGLDELLNLEGCNLRAPTAAGNAKFALIDVIIERADRLANDLDRLEGARRKEAS